MIGHQIIQIHEVDSTNNYAAKLLSEGKLTHGTVILAEHQTSGRGQRGRNWQTSALQLQSAVVASTVSFLFYALQHPI